MKGLSLSKKIVISLLAVMMLFSVTLGIVSMNAVAEVTPADPKPTLVMTKGASVRKENPNGIRFQAEMNQAKYDEVFAEGSNKQVGMFIVPAYYFDEFLDSKDGINDFYKYCKEIKKSIVDFKFTKDQVVKEGEKYLLKASLVEILFKNINLDFNAGVYVETMEGDVVNSREVVYDDTNARSISYVASSAINHGETSEYLTNTIKTAGYEKLGVKYNMETSKYSYKGTEYETLEAIGIDPLSAYSLDKESVVAKIGETVTITPDANLKELDVIWSTSDEKVATVNSGVVSVIANGSAVITAKAGTIEKTCNITVSDSRAVDLSFAQATNWFSNIEFAGATIGYSAEKTFNGQGTIVLNFNGSTGETSLNHNFLDFAPGYDVYFYLFNAGENDAKVGINWREVPEQIAKVGQWSLITFPSEAFKVWGNNRILFTPSAGALSTIYMSSVYTTEPNREVHIDTDTHVDSEITLTELPDKFYNGKVFNLNLPAKKDWTNLVFNEMVVDPRYDVVEVSFYNGNKGTIQIYSNWENLQYIGTGEWLTIRYDRSLFNKDYANFNIRRMEVVDGSETGAAFDGEIYMTSIVAKKSLTGTGKYFSITNLEGFDGTPVDFQGKKAVKIDINSTEATWHNLTFSKIPFDEYVFDSNFTCGVFVYNTNSNPKTTVKVNWTPEDPLGDVEPNKWTFISFDRHTLGEKTTEINILGRDGNYDPAAIDGDIYISEIFIIG